MKPYKNLTFDNDAGDLMIAVEDAMSAIYEAMESMAGYGELEEWYTELDGIYDELERRKDEFEGYMAGEHQALLAELSREYYKDQLWEG